ncbi:MAG TPA: site-2 protease family protein [Thermoanaerobaculia bacterium]|jgi:Zn-dependent protease|nr:site-2 protease family protein [Thermoanaerobaculia bacterium]
MYCAGCGSELAPSLRACPVCHRLVHQAALEDLAAAADRARRAGDASAELLSWRSASELLPAGSRQLAQLSGRIEELSRQVATPAEAKKRANLGGAGKTGLAATIGAVLWKLKLVLLALLGKAKLLLLGLSKAGTLLTMLLSFGAYWALWGWKFAAGLVLSIYVHEMGHVAALRRFGIPATAPMFIPGLGAFVRLKQRPASPVEDARVGLAGPIWGLGAALAAWGVGAATGAPAWMAIARAGAWINLFNLLPIAPLDGGRGFHALSRPQRWLAAAALAAAWWISRDGLVILLGLVAIGQAMAGKTVPQGDRRTLFEYAGLVLAFAALTKLPVPVPP